MNVLEKRRSLGLMAVAAAAASITWVSASGVVVLYPATVAGSLNLPSETVTSINAQLAPVTGGQAITRTVAATGPGPYPFELTVDGGDPDDPADAGAAYRPAVYAYLQNATASQTYLAVYRSGAIAVDNTAADPSTTVPVSFDYPVTRRANVSITVIGGTLGSYWLSASASATSESYAGYTSGSATSQAALAQWLPMVPASAVYVSGSVTVVNGQGTSSQRSLPSQAVDLSAGDGAVSWTIDLTNTGSLEGEIAPALPPGGTATPSGYYVVYQGASSSTSGINGQLYVGTADPRYALALTPGDYDVHLRTYFTTPSGYAETPRVRVAIAAGATVVRNYDDAFGAARVDLEVGGFYDLADTQSVSSRLLDVNDQSGYAFQLTAGGFDYVVPAGTWHRFQTALGLYDGSNPELPTNNQIYRTYYADPDAAAVAVEPTGVAVLGSESFTLVKSNVYFDVAETQAQKDQGITIEVASPQVQAIRRENNPDNSLRRYTQVYAYGSSTPQARSALTMVAEPGTYDLTATAIVNGTRTLFGGTSITFGEPVPSEPGVGVETVLTPVQNPLLQVALTFGEVTEGGITTVVETPLGPAPPEGFSALCEPALDGAGDPDLTCDPIYYDITSNVAWDHAQGATVCIRRQYVGIVGNGVSEVLALHHYNEVTGDWDRLPGIDVDGDGIPETAFDCNADLELCGCDDGNGGASCGIDLNAYPVRSAFLVCGVTSSFSPFAIFAQTKFDNVVGGVAYTGPTGPPELQRWTAPGAGTYRITAVGAAGAAGTNSPARKGGCGAEVRGEFALAAGDQLEILVGQRGTAAPYSAGGGGGTFVTRAGAPLLIAGGGGGVRAGATVDGRPGTQAATGVAGSTSAGYTSGFIAGGVDGAGGARAVSYGAGGGGWSGDGASDASYGEGGFAYAGASRARGGAGKACGAPAHGGYGGGGAGNGCYGGGGGGGYAGGGGGRIGGGGGSLNTGANPGGEDGKCTPSGHGRVIIQRVL